MNAREKMEALLQGKTLQVGGSDCFLSLTSSGNFTRSSPVKGPELPLYAFLGPDREVSIKSKEVPVKIEALLPAAELEPLPESTVYYIPNTTHNSKRLIIRWGNDPSDFINLRSGLVYLKEEDAITVTEFLNSILPTANKIGEL